MNRQLQFSALLLALVVQSECYAAGPAKEIEHRIAGKLVLLPAGEYLMGAPDSDPEATLNEQPVHSVKIDAPFYIGAHEVTVAQFRQFIAATGYRTEAERDGVGGWGYDQATRRFAREGLRYTWKETGFEQKGQYPVVNVTWNDCVAFCEWLSGKDSTHVFRLPTEAEWEYAARGGTNTIYSHGESRTKLIGKENVADKSIALILAREPAELAVINQAAPWADRYPFTAEVGSFKPNPFGLYDMHGNVGEWVDDWYDEEKYVKGDATPPKKGSHKVYRGGSWAMGPAHSRSSSRHRFVPSERWCHIGFRIVAEIPK